MLEIVTDPVDMAALVRAVEDPAAGAVVTFAGVTRNETRGRAVVELAYEAYPGMAEAKLAEIGQATARDFDVVKVAIVHRVATLAIGEVSVGIAVSAAHRPPAFAACRFAIEAIKKDLPVWKKEVFADGTTEWVHPGVC